MLKPKAKPPEDDHIDELDAEIAEHSRVDDDEDEPRYDDEQPLFDPEESGR